jgi:hypothetical protein
MRYGARVPKLTTDLRRLIPDFQLGQTPLIGMIKQTIQQKLAALHPFIQRLQKQRAHQGAERTAERNPPLDVVEQSPALSTPARVLPQQPQHAFIRNVF